MPLNADAMSLGAGYLYLAPLGSTEPTDLASAWPGGWAQVGYTEDGHVMNYEVTVEDIIVAEVVGPVRSENSERKITVEFAMAEITATNLMRAMNGGTSTSGGGIVTVQPPSLQQAPTQVMLGWDAFPLTDGGTPTERIVWRKCVQSAAFGISRKKPPAYATIPVAFRVLENASALPFKHIFDDALA